jgi:hypothetical protein
MVGVGRVEAARFSTWLHPAAAQETITNQNANKKIRGKITRCIG